MDLWRLPKHMSGRPYSLDLEIDTLINIKTCWSNGQRKTPKEMREDFYDKLRIMIDNEQIEFQTFQVYEPDEVFRNVLDKSTGEVKRRHLFWILEQINCRCDDDGIWSWSDYDETDWEKGWKEWVEPEGRYSIVE